MLNQILSRRSIRKFTDKTISREDLNALVKAGMYAPSAKGARPWHFIVVDDKEILAKIHEAHPYSSMLENAPACIMVCGDRNLEGEPDYYMEDCAAATQNILLYAHGLGIGSCWLGVRPREYDMHDKYRALFNLTQDIVPFCFIALGYPESIPPMPNRVEENKIHWNKW